MGRSCRWMSLTDLLDRAAALRRLADRTGDRATVLRGDATTGFREPNRHELHWSRRDRPQRAGRRGSAGDRCRQDLGRLRGSGVRNRTRPDQTWTGWRRLTVVGRAGRRSDFCEPRRFRHAVRSSSGRGGLRSGTLKEFDGWLGGLLERVRDDDLVITHGGSRKRSRPVARVRIAPGGSGCRCACCSAGARVRWACGADFADVAATWRKLWWPGSLAGRRWWPQKIRAEGSFRL